MALSSRDNDFSSVITFGGDDTVVVVKLVVIFMVVMSIFDAIEAVMSVVGVDTFTGIDSFVVVVMFLADSITLVLTVVGDSVIIEIVGA